MFAYELILDQGAKGDVVDEGKGSGWVQRLTSGPRWNERVGDKNRKGQNSGVGAGAILGWGFDG